MTDYSIEQLGQFYEDGGETLFDRMLQLEKVLDDYRRSVFREIGGVRTQEKLGGETINRLREQSNHVARLVDEMLQTIFLDDEMRLDEKLDLTWEVITQDTSTRKIVYKAALDQSDEYDEEQLIESASNEMINLEDYRGFCVETYYEAGGTEQEKLELLHRTVSSDYLIGVNTDFNVFSAELLDQQVD
jgi:hypothetical protein